MINLFKAELFSFIKQRNVNLLLLGIVGIGILGVLYTTILLNEPVNPEQYFQVIYQNFYMIALVIIVFFSVLSFHDEYENKTIKNSIFQGFSRMELLVSKISVIIVVGLGLLFLSTIIVVLGSIKISASSEQISQFITGIIGSIPGWIVYAVLFESFLFMTKKVIVGLFLAYAIEQIVKLPLILFSAKSELIYSLWQATPSFVLQNISINYDKVLYLGMSAVLAGIVIFVSKIVLQKKEVPI